MTYEETLAWIADIFEESKENIHPELSRSEIADVGFSWDPDAPVKA